MKRRLLMIVLALGALTFAIQAQSLPAQILAATPDKMVEKPAGPKWRALTFNTQFGVGSYDYNTTSANLFYEFDRGIAITSWLGYNHRFDGSTGWASAQFLVNKLFGEGQKWRVGTGFAYNSSADNPFSSSIATENTSFILIEMSYRIKFK